MREEDLDFAAAERRRRMRGWLAAGTFVVVIGLLLLFLSGKEKPPIAKTKTDAGVTTAPVPTKTATKAQKAPPKKKSKRPKVPPKISKKRRKWYFDVDRFRTSPEYEDLVTLLAEPDEVLAGDTTVSEKELDQLLDRRGMNLLYRKKILDYVSPIFIKKSNRRTRDVTKVLVSKERLKLGRAFVAEHNPTLSLAHSRFGVRKADLVSMLNIESKFGRIQGSYRVASTFLTQLVYLEKAEEIAFSKGKYKKKNAISREVNLRRIALRKERAGRNLAALLKYSKSRKIDARKVNGSWAGAIGIPQFMPASLRWAEDGDGDGVIDLSRMEDAIMSTARYLKEHGYEATDTAKRREAFFAYNESDAYVDAIVEFASRFGYVN